MALNDKHLPSEGQCHRFQHHTCLSMGFTANERYIDQRHLTITLNCHFKCHMDAEKYTIEKHYVYYPVYPIKEGLVGIL